ncbi:MAG: lysophospholipid acyltransferase family protein [Deltaproteobacteria bacterium]|jgi:predicted LPLAT superfamily acyltransferase|nr:lysophospholipid acyltransferase family protein [Deltaproteobacteria bacterium]
MKGWFYKTLIAGAKAFGQWFFKLFAWFVATGYFLFRPHRRNTGINFYGALFPDRAFIHHLWCTWRQFHDFTQVFLERALISGTENTAVFSSTGMEHLERAVSNRTGGVMIMSHAGNWEAAAHHLTKELPGIDLLLYMGKKQKEQIERLQKNDLINAGIKVIAVDEEGGSPFDIVEGVQQLKNGGMVSMAGDVLFRKDQRNVRISFLGHEAVLPETPYLLALLSKVPVYVFFAWRTGRGHYHVSISEPIHMKCDSRAQRRRAIAETAQEYADHLARNIRQHPFQWYHFEPFLGKKGN